MRRLLASIAFAGLLPFSFAYADIASDVAADLPASQIIANAQAEGLTIEQIMQQVAAADASLLDAIVTAAIDAGLNPGAVVNAAAAAGGDRTAMETAAILAGADPTEVSEATAAGGPTAGTPAPAIPTATNNAINPPAFGNNAGGGGGGNPSAT